jgi:hypothetical protein
MRKILEVCPSCGSDLVVSEMRCTACETVIRGRWEPCRFCRLGPKDLAFVEAFVRNRGNLKEMEREMSESYWTLRAQLNEVIEALGLEGEPAPPSDPIAELRRQILQQVQAGVVEVAEAARQLASLKRSENDQEEAS